MSSDYGFSLTTFSPTGKLVQIEYALNAVNIHGRSALGMRFNKGAIVCTEKKLTNSLIEEDSVVKVEKITDSIGCTYAGMPADFRLLLIKARKIAVMYEHTYGEQIPVLQMAKELSNIMQEYTQSGGVRPFGCSLFVSGHDSDHYQLYQIDPSGTYFAWKASAIGKDSDNAKLFLEKRYKEDMSVEDAIHVALLTLRELCEIHITENSVEIGVCEDGKFYVLRPEEIKAYLRDTE